MIARGSLHDAIIVASLAINKNIPVENIRIINRDGIVAEGWDESTEYLVENMYFGENEIKPCADLLVHSFDEETVEFMVFIAGYGPSTYRLNRSGGVGPFIKAYDPKLLEEYEHNK